MSEEIETQPEEMITEQPKAGLLEKLKIHKFKILAAFLGVFVFAGAVFGAYKLEQKQIKSGPKPTPIAEATPTPDSTASWETYTNTRYGYSIKYPQEVIYKESSFREEGEEKQEISTIFYIDGGSLEIVGNIGGMGISAIRVQDMILGGVKTTKIYLTTTRGVIQAIPCLKGDEIYFSFRLPSDSAELNRVDNLIDLMLSTFRFLENSGCACIEESLLNCAEEKELSFQCTEEYQSWARENCPGWEKYVYCEDPRPEVCTMECISNPPYICGSNGKSYCSECQACANPEVEWYIIQNEPCEAE